MGKYLDLIERSEADNAPRAKSAESAEIDKSNTYVREKRGMACAKSPPGQTENDLSAHSRAAFRAANSLENNISRLSRFSRTLTELERRCPDHIEPARWNLAIEDGRRFLAHWGNQAEALDWTSRDLFGLHEVPANPHPNYRRLGRYDCTGLIWLLQGWPVVALTDATAAIKAPTGSIVTYRKHHKPAYGPLGDSLDDFVA